ncbi:hypothetical protein Tco_0463608, partial [Tanacetum coccineum]
GCTVPLLPVAPDRAESELEASVGRLFDERGSGNQIEQGDSAGGGQGANIQPESRAFTIREYLDIQSTQNMDRTRVMENASLLTH